MWIELIGRGVPTNNELRSDVERRLMFALGRFSGSLGRITVHLIDENGPRGGVDKLCRIVVGMTGRGPSRLVVEAAAAKIPAAVNMAANRISQVVRRQVERARWTPQRADDHLFVNN